jgi:four helix bundle protein
MRDHKSLEAWKEARFVMGGVVDLCKESWKAYVAALFSQLQKAALSAQLNIAEGYASGSRRSFANYLKIAYGSAVETGEILELFHDKEIVPTQQAKLLIDHCRRSQRLLLGLIKKYRSG